MRTHNIGFYEDLTKIIFELSSNTHLIFLLLIFSISFEPHSNKTDNIPFAHTRVCPVNDLDQSGPPSNLTNHCCVHTG